MAEIVPSFSRYTSLATHTPTGGHAVEVKVIIIPADGSAPYLRHLMTRDVSSQGNMDRFLYHVPDMQYSWGYSEGWQSRDIERVEIKGHGNPSVNGVYYGFKCFNFDLPRNKHIEWGVWGDACIAKMSEERYAGRGVRVFKMNGEDVMDFKNEFSQYANYDDIDEDIIKTGLWKGILERLSKV